MSSTNDRGRYGPGRRSKSERAKRRERRRQAKSMEATSPKDEPTEEEDRRFSDNATLTIKGGREVNAVEAYGVLEDLNEEAELDPEGTKQLFLLAKGLIDTQQLSEENTKLVVGEQTGKTTDWWDIAKEIILAGMQETAEGYVVTNPFVVSEESEAILAKMESYEERSVARWVRREADRGDQDRSR